MIFALARPQTTTKWEESTTEGIDIILAIDISSSMNEKDLKPNRLESAKEVAKDFGTKPVKGGIKFGKPGTGVKDTIKNFQPRDISAKKYEKKVETGLKKAQKSFKQLSRDIRDYRDRDVPGGPRKTRVTRTRVSFRTTPGGRESVGMASKFVNKYKKGHPMNPEISGIDFDKPVNAQVVNQSILKKSAAAYSKLAKNNPALGGVAGIAAYDIGKGILGKVKKYTKSIVQTLNVQKPTRTGRISAGT